MEFLNRTIFVQNQESVLAQFLKLDSFLKKGNIKFNTKVNNAMRNTTKIEAILFIIMMVVRIKITMDNDIIDNNNNSFYDNTGDSI